MRYILLNSVQFFCVWVIEFFSSLWHCHSHCPEVLSLFGFRNLTPTWLFLYTFPHTKNSETILDSSTAHVTYHSKSYHLCLWNVPSIQGLSLIPSCHPSLNQLHLSHGLLGWFSMSSLCTTTAPFQSNLYSVTRKFFEENRSDHLILLF